MPSKRKEKARAPPRAKPAAGPAQKPKNPVVSSYNLRTRDQPKESELAGKESKPTEAPKLQTGGKSLERLKAVYGSTQPLTGSGEGSIEQPASDVSGLPERSKDPVEENHWLETENAAVLSTEMSRNKSRNGSAREENEEELAMFSQVQLTLKKLAGIQNRQKMIYNETVETEKALATAESNGRSDEIGPNQDKLETLYRENLKLTSDERAILTQEPHDLIKNIEILKALRYHTEINQQKAPPPLKARKLKGSRSEVDSTVESPGPTPGMASSATRIKGAASRSGSVPFTRESKEVAVKAEDNADGAKGSAAERAGKLVMGAEVAYKQARPKEDGSQWIQCTIISVTEIGNKKTYRVQDTEPDETGVLGDVYKATAASLIAIPSKGSALPDYPVGKHVLARYPDTSTFYGAEVTSMKKDKCNLKFEDDMDQEMEVDRRYVLDMTNK